MKYLILLAFVAISCHNKKEVAIEIPKMEKTGKEGLRVYALYDTSVKLYSYGWIVDTTAIIIKSRKRKDRHK